MDKIAKLKEFIEKRPGDPFPRYGLAMEYKKEGRLGEAVEAFQGIVAEFPDYTPAYFHFGAVLVKSGREEEAERVYLEGIEVAEKNSDAHAKEELQEALQEISEE